MLGMLPSDGRVSGYDKIAGGLDISPAHLAAYAEAVEKALDAAIDYLEGLGIVVADASGDIVAG